MATLFEQGVPSVLAQSAVSCPGQSIKKKCDQQRGEADVCETGGPDHTTGQVEPIILANGPDTSQ